MANSIEENGGNGMVMPVAPAYGGGYGSNSFGNDGWWIVLLIILLAGSRGFGGGYGGYGDGGNGNGYLVQQGFDQAALSNGIAGVQSSLSNGFNAVQTSLCNGFAGVNSNVQNGFAQAEIAANARQMADMQQNFALSQQFSQCCCDNRLATANLAAQISQENCADRQAVNDALYNLTNQMNAGFQGIRDEFCQDRLSRKDEIIADLRQQINERDRVASQNTQTAQIEAGQRLLASEIENYVRPQANPCYVVPNPNCCPQNYGYSYGCVA